MNEYALLKLGHLLLFVYWLGGDLGTFYASRFVTRTDLSVPARATALRIMTGCDQAPRICMTLIVALGLHAAWRAGMVDVGATAVVVTWLVSVAWLGMVLALHFGRHKSWARPLAQFDFGFRFLIIAVAVSVGVYALLSGQLVRPDWLALKFLLFAGLVGCGLVIRILLKPFGPAFAQLLREGSTPEIERILASSLGRCRPFVYLIWLGLLLAAALSLRVITV